MDRYQIAVDILVGIIAETCPRDTQYLQLQSRVRDGMEKMIKEIRKELED